MTNKEAANAARLRGDRFYTYDVGCEHGLTTCYTSSKGCVECAKALSTKRRAILVAYRLEIREKHRQRIAERKRLKESGNGRG